MMGGRMATYHAIATTGEAIVGVLRDARTAVAAFEGAQIELYQSTNFQNPMQEGISLYLYNVTTNMTKRNLPPRIDSDGRRFRPPLPVDLHYLLVSWSASPVKQQWLLGWSMRVLEDTPILPARVLNYYGSAGETFRPNETVELVCQPISLQEIVNIWDAFKPSLQVSVAYIARMIEIDSQIEVIEGAPVQARVFNFGKEYAR
jgi:Pvc16 N-terminal domain